VYWMECINEFKIIQWYKNKVPKSFHSLVNSGQSSQYHTVPEPVSQSSRGLQHVSLLLGFIFKTPGQLEINQNPTRKLYYFFSFAPNVNWSPKHLLKFYILLFKPPVMRSHPAAARLKVFFASVALLDSAKSPPKYSDLFIVKPTSMNAIDHFRTDIPIALLQFLPNAN